MEPVTVRRHISKLRKIMHNGFFVLFPLKSTTELANEGQVKMWRAVVDQHLKDIISHHLEKRNFNQYYDSIRFFREQESGKGQEYALAMLDEQRMLTLVNKFETVCRNLRDRGVEL